MESIAQNVLALTAAVLLSCITPAYASEPPVLDLTKDALRSTGDPPVIPHAVNQAQDGEECNACHRTGSHNAPPTDHPERLNCTSCHVQGELKKEGKAAGKGKQE